MIPWAQVQLDEESKNALRRANLPQCWAPFHFLNIEKGLTSLSQFTSDPIAEGYYALAIRDNDGAIAAEVSTGRIFYLSFSEKRIEERPCYMNESIRSMLTFMDSTGPKASGDTSLRNRLKELDPLAFQGDNYSTFWEEVIQEAMHGL